MLVRLPRQIGLPLLLALVLELLLASPALGIDTTPPTAFVLSPTPATRATATHALVVQVQASDNQTPPPLLTVTYEVSHTGNAGPYQLIAANVPYQPGYTWSSVTGPLTSQAVLRVSVRDQAGNVGTAFSAAFSVVPLSRQDARALITQQVITPSPYESTLVAFLWHSTGAESLLAPGATVSDWEGTFTRNISTPTYFAFLDDQVDMEWTHAATYVFIDATTGVLSREESASWPVVNGGEQLMMQDGNLSPDRFYGSYPGPGPLFQYDMTTAGTTNVWALIVVGKNLTGATEKDARKQDIDRIEKMLNGLATGPRISGNNIRVAAGTDYEGASNQAICDSLAQMTGCSKLYFYYIGHGNEGGGLVGVNGGSMITNNPGTGNKMPYKELGEKLLDSPIEEVCLIIEDCYSGGAIDELAKVRKALPGGGTKALKGTIVTSSLKGHTTGRQADGAAFNKALLACMQDPQANIDGLPGVTFFEAAAWAKLRNLIVRRDCPQGFILGDGKRVDLGASGRTELEDNKDARGDLVYVTEQVGYNVEKGAAGQDSLVRRRTVYVENRTATAHSGGYKVDVICVDNKKPPVTHVLKTFRPEMPAKEKPGARVCLGDLPADCGPIKIRRTNPQAPDGLLRPLSQPAPATWNTLTRATLYRRGEYLLQEFPVSAPAGHPIHVNLTPLAGWGLNAGSPEFLAASPLDVEPLLMHGSVPDTASQGGYFGVTLRDMSAGDTTCWRVHALILDSLATPLAGGVSRNHLALRLPFGGAVNSGTTTLKGCRLGFDRAGTFSVGAGGRLDLDDTVLDVDSTTSCVFSIAGHLEWARTTLLQPATGLRLSSAVGHMFQTAVISSRGAGVVLAGDLSGLEVEGLLVDRSAGDGLVAQGPLVSRLRDARLLNSGGEDVRLTGAANLRLVDAEYDDNNVSVEPGSTLTRSWTTLFHVQAPGGTEVPGVIISKLDAVNVPGAADTTDLHGLSHSDLNGLDEYTQAGLTRVYKTPYQVTLAWAGRDTTLTVAVNQTRVVEITWYGAQSAVPPPTDFALLQNAPNPFATSTAISFDVCRPSSVTLRIFSADGRLVRTLLDGVTLSAARHAQAWNGRTDRGAEAPGGLYFYCLEVDGRSFARRMVRVK